MFCQAMSLDRLIHEEEKMKYIIKDEQKGRIRIYITNQKNKRLSDRKADALMEALSSYSYIKKVKVQPGISCVVIRYACARKKLLALLDRISWKQVLTQDDIPENSSRSINQHFQNQLKERILLRILSRAFLPIPIRNVITVVNSTKYFVKAAEKLLDKKVETSLLDALALGVSYFRADYDGAGSVVFLLDLAEILESWIEKKKLESLSETMALNIDYVWSYTQEGEIRVSVDRIQNGDLVVVNTGEMIPFDGRIRSGAGSVVQTSLTGNSLPQSKQEGDFVYAGTYLEEGEFVIEVTEENHTSRYDKIVSLVDNSQDLKPAFESQAIAKANAMVPYLLGGSLFTYLLSRSTDRAFSFLMVDYSYAMKLAMPMAVLTARDQAVRQSMLVKGGRFMENMAQADYIVFDKTGTLTKAQPVLKHIHSYGSYSELQLLSIAACMEEHVTNSVSKAIVDAYKKYEMDHEEVHSEIENVYAHGVITQIHGNRILFGSYHFVFEDEKCPIPEGLIDELQGSEHAKQHHMFLAINERLEGIFCVEDELREEVVQVIKDLRQCGFRKVILLSGDTELSAKEAAKEAQISTYYADKMPEEKATYIKQLQEQGHKVVMVGDGVNDSLALSVADVGIAVSAGASVSKELADVVIDSDDLFSIVKLREISDRLMKRMRVGYDSITISNEILIALGVMGVLTPAGIGNISNLTTLAISLGMRIR